ncbi:peroxide stress-activated histidine kinase mak1 [Colletotrichum spaethianum]|uniref:Peroxide stress-activated histidine kinase mak1 n=1 Tax=Colletotrichum spaethianum TaxID=700344 RepID=A0AA37NYM2_9PEZI|nr:peroxide stress-activated histidine kinase mak1 [Colletotrichum spaethianum]GKT41303.1 peroxide stress-activated histidine kinase mak1 [Colletotrichum spaethianum]
MLLVFDRWSAVQGRRIGLKKESSASGIPQIIIESELDQLGMKFQSLSSSSIQPSDSDDSGIQVESKLQEKSAPRPKPFKSNSAENPTVEFLLVEDNPINLKILSTYMNKLGVRFNTATDGRKALEAYVRNPAECKYILTDVSMPVMDGFEATRQIRAHEKALGLAPATIIALTGLASSESQNEAFTSGMDLFLTKPVKLKELEAILNSRGLLG